MAHETSASLSRSIHQEVDLFWSADVQIEATWDREDGSAVVLYRTTRDPLRTLLGQTFEFGPGVADDTFEGAASAAALSLAEPPGALMEQAKLDQNGVTWLALGPSPLPVLPPRIQTQLAHPPSK